MKIGRKPGVTRRPIEYLLVAVLCVLVTTLLWSSYALGQTEKIDQAAAVMGVATTQPVNRIGTVTQADSTGEYRMAGKLIRQQSSAFDDSDEALEQIISEYNKHLPELRSCTDYTNNFDSTLNALNDKIDNFYLELDDDIDDNDERRNNYDIELTGWRTNQDANRIRSYESYDADDLDRQAKLYMLDELTTGRRHHLDSLVDSFWLAKHQASDYRITTIKTNINLFIKNIYKISNTARDYCDKASPSDAVASDIIDSHVSVGQDLQLAISEALNYKQGTLTLSVDFKTQAKANLSEFQVKYHDLIPLKFD